MVWIAIPFTIGVALANLFEPSPALAATSLLLFALLFILSDNYYPKHAAFAALFLLAGLFCGASAGLCSPPGDSPAWQPAERAASALRAHISSLSWSSARTPALLHALLCGERGGIDKATYESFRDSGASHLLALSGLHLGIIHSVVSGLLKIMKQLIGPLVPLKHYLRFHLAYSYAKALLSCSFAAFYTLMTGASASTLRALIFIIFREISAVSPQRSISSGRLWLSSLTIQLALRPEELLNAGFQLSYLAMAGICFVLPHIKDWYPGAEDGGRLRDPLKKIWDLVAMSLACQLFTAPAAYLLFGTFPKYFIICNLLATPLTTILVSSSVICLALFALGLECEILLHLIDKGMNLLLLILETISSM